ncbi:MAG: cupin domain-containing protein [Chloroflexi bacterium]|nr:cupin domain-containing protein [Chloroflexota bacterium]
MSYFCDVENREAREIVPGVKIRTFWQTEMLVSVVNLEPGAVVPMHSHPHEQSGTVISGQMDLTIDGETRTLTSGDCYIIPGNVQHKAIGGPQGAHVIDIFAPVREEYQY